MPKSRFDNGGMPSQRQLRMGELVRKELSEVFSRGDVQDPVLDGVILTIPEVRLTPDLRMATVLIMPLGGENAENVVIALNKCRKFLRGQISRRLTAKFMPDLKFVLDTRFDDDDRIGELLQQPTVAKDIQKNDKSCSSDDTEQIDIGK